MAGKKSPKLKAQFLKDILARNGTPTLRILSCKHQQLEPKGSRAKDATKAYCETCEAESRAAGETPAIQESA